MFNKFKCLQPTTATIVETNLHTKNKYKEKRKINQKNKVINLLLIKKESN